MLARVFVIFQHLLPRYGLTALVRWLSRIRNVRVKNALIGAFTRLYDVNLDEAAGRTPIDFPTLNAFFTRELVSGMRPTDPAADAIVSPVDGRISAAGTIDRDAILQAKGLSYTLRDLFAVNLEAADTYTGGRFATLYLAPHNYHRVHMPVDGDLVAAHYVPGDLYSVNEATVSRLRGLFRRNERLVLHFATSSGPMAVIFVGALNVGSISTPWSGEIRPRKRGVVDDIELNDAPTRVAKGDLLGWFNMGSTVIVLFPPGSGDWSADLAPGAPVQVGRRIGTLAARGD